MGRRKQQPEQPRANDDDELRKLVGPIDRPDPTVRRERVRHVAYLMASGEYVRGQTPADLAAEWGVKVNLVEHDAAVASMLLDLLEDREALKRRIQVRLDGIAFSELHQTKDVIAATKLLAEVSGIIGGGSKGSGLEPPTAAANDELRELLRDPPGWLADMLAAHGWMRIESEAG